LLGEANMVSPIAGSLLSCIDRAALAFGGAPTYLLTDNDKTVTTQRVAGIAVGKSIAWRVARLHSRHGRVSYRRRQGGKFEPISLGGSQWVSLQKKRTGPTRDWGRAARRRTVQAADFGGVTCRLSANKLAPS